MIQYMTYALWIWFLVGCVAITVFYFSAWFVAKQKPDGGTIAMMLVVGVSWPAFLLALPYMAIRDRRLAVHDE